MWIQGAVSISGGICREWVHYIKQIPGIWVLLTLYWRTDVPWFVMVWYMRCIHTLYNAINRSIYKPEICIFDTLSSVALHGIISASRA